MIPELFTKDGFALEGFLTHCSFDYLNRDIITRSFMMAMFIGGYVIPLLLIIIFCSLFYHNLKKSEVFMGLVVTELSRPNNFQENFSTRHSTIAYTARSPMNEKKIVYLHKSEAKLYVPETFKKQQIIKNEIKIAKLLCMMVSTFSIAWLPYALLVLYAQFGTNIEYFVNPYSTNLPSLIAKTSSIYYPIIFISSDRRCRRYLKQKFRIF